MNPRLQQVIQRDQAQELLGIPKLDNRKLGESSLGHAVHNDSQRLAGIRFRDICADNVCYPGVGSSEGWLLRVLFDVSMRQHPDQVPFSIGNWKQTLVAWSTDGDLAEILEGHGGGKRGHVRP